MDTPRAKKNTRVGRANERQLKLLVDYMSTHSGLASGRFTGSLGFEKTQRHWQTLSAMLNELGGIKDIEQWKKTWRDLKRNVRAKAARINAGCGETGSKPVTEVLSEMEEKCLAVIGTEMAAGLPIPEFCESVPTASTSNTSASMPAISASDNVSSAIAEELETSRAQDDEGTTSNPKEAVQHMEINVEDLFPKEDAGSSRQKNQGDLLRVTTMILDTMKALEKKEDLMVRKVNALESIAKSLERRAVAAERRAAAAERKAAAEERKAAAQE
ncbi:uncharacterized protein LOC124170700 isoform X2 [Ischnura elegans]|uniref:uncharacterized protein LOC124170700 isoform X2 n=1 Tax=Ischnura elegans TaxID=197161 RepID=UPI001ED87D55|nr:uncharacterized protein LOC124170700 isoform X2 [Ischnura elegans]